MASETQVVTLCEQDATPCQEEFLHRVLSEEIAARERSRRARLMNRAHFPVLKSLEGYEFGCVRLPSSFPQKELISCRFIQEKKNLVLYGPVGIGKTHLAIALGVKACEMGLKVRFHIMIPRLKTQKLENKLNWRHGKEKQIHSRIQSQGGPRSLTRG
ncbi:MAG: hypothetical protein EOM62_12875 [Bacteroidia bacterium]|nr:hypothetical protein [Bacteroidia bacterium]